MIIRQNNYLKNKKKKYIKRSIIWFVIMLSIFITGLILNKTRKNIFTVVAAVLVLPVAQYTTQLFAILKFKDPDDETSHLLESVKGDYNLFHSVLIPDQSTIINFDHIVITGQNIFCIVDKRMDISKIKESFNRKIKAKGISINDVIYLENGNTKDIRSFLKKIEKSAQISNKDSRDEYTKLIEQMIM